MTGNLSHQIEHHLFPDLPSNRYARDRAEGPRPLPPVRPALPRRPDVEAVRRRALEDRAALVPRRARDDREASAAARCPPAARPSPRCAACANGLLRSPPDRRSRPARPAPGCDDPGVADAQEWREERERFVDDQHEALGPLAEEFVSLSEALSVVESGLGVGEVLERIVAGRAGRGRRRRRLRHLAPGRRVHDAGRDRPGRQQGRRRAVRARRGPVRRGDRAGRASDTPPRPTCAMTPGGRSSGRPPPTSGCTPCSRPACSPATPARGWAR